MVLMNTEQHIWVEIIVAYGESAENIPTKLATLTFTWLNTGYSGGTHSFKYGIKPLFF